MADVRDIIKRPIITEKTADLMVDKKYTFEVDPRATRTQVKLAVEEIFGVKVVNVNTMNYKGKFKRFGRHSGYTRKRKKAIVQLSADSKELEFFEGA
ncbi:50S ribosomal protein L23 [Salipaludibacillus agaradhaerens]|jgi:large subunit ribosomal protein L23|uniref:Large ribosomal subunit protein uL23 n=1 Tax=Salipaludibacillus agaradhaerens TaxID=76935 RepID=A0A9Q4G0Y2_SALAG|nr:50S ribosomal protein L23 [Salipaludibacillus agaradhaerens]UJW56061.1 50S ribosomal protein L23 [Bacillus sp. A116_S68]MCR6098343.1 50S ribosomal protein L23 [Salipaludibacillus agaradhaerens]MCR6104821.1 50S ribosomal protein L23 [Salipaludibacillus agaradhaerens]MCR6116027.1 50S ribosomal protein L23 [Salipaludibacillus agaradhaerens]MCR6116869.1 50S ribosomal protein L23 [Salipaludibacillus agaradhaerens]